MRRAVAGIWGTPAAKGRVALAVTVTFFILGSFLGCISAFHAAGAADDALSGYLSRFLQNARDGALSSPALATQLWQVLRWPLGAFLLGFTALGVFGIPVLAGARAFFLAFSVASFTRVYGQAGLAMAFLLLGLTSLVAVPAFFVLSTQSLQAACALAGRSGGTGRLPYDKRYFLCCGGCAAAFCVCFLLERFFLAALVSGAAGSLSL